MIKRLKTFIKSLSLSERAFALQCGIAQNTMNYYLTEQRKPSYDAIEKILITYPNLSAEWLTRGNGPMLLSQNGASEHTEDSSHKIYEAIIDIQATISSQHSMIATLANRVLQLESNLTK